MFSQICTMTYKTTGKRNSASFPQISCFSRLRSCPDISREGGFSDSSGAITQFLDPDQNATVDSSICYHTLLSLAQLTLDARQNWCSSLYTGWVVMSHKHSTW